MRKLLLLAFTLFTLTGLTAQTVFVDADATGANDGTSWANAYSELDSAFVRSPAGSSIWIADGTYVTPAGGSFFVNYDVSILGGFNGTETSADQADPAANVTILSGDVMGNDPAMGYDSIAALDNSRILAVVTTEMNPDVQVAIDGITFTNGIIAMNGDDLVANAGGAIVSFAELAISRCIFTKCRASYGSGVALFNPSANGTSLTDVTMVDNYTFINREVYTNRTDSISYTNCSFTGQGDENPEALTGAVRSFGGVGHTFRNCSFSDYNTPLADGAAIILVATDEVLIEDCSFTDLVSFGPAVGFQENINLDPQDTESPGSITINNSTFTNCQAAGFGAAALSISNYSADLNDVDVDKCSSVNLGGAAILSFDNVVESSYVFNVNGGSWTDNSSASSGGAIFTFVDFFSTVDMNWNDVTITDNSAGGAGGNGGFIRVQNLGRNSEDGSAPDKDQISTYDFTGCTFSGNNGTGDGGVGAWGLSFNDLENFASVEINYDDCTFTENSAGDDGGVISIVPSAVDRITDKLTITNSTLTDNEHIRYGSLALFGNMDTEIDNVTFEGNGGELAGAGGAIASLNNGRSSITIDNSTFFNNTIAAGVTGLPDGGGAIFIWTDTLNRIAVDISNSEFSQNSAGGTTSGGAIYSILSNFMTITNTDFLDNTSGGGGGAINAVSGDFGGVLIGDNLEFIFGVTDITLDRSAFISNTAATQGGAINTQAGIADIQNSIFARNTVSTDGASGGAIIFNGNSPAFDLMSGSFDSVGTRVLEGNLVNNTFVFNSKGGSTAAVGDQIAIFQPGETVFNEKNSITLNLLNNAFLLDAPANGGLFQVNVEPGFAIDADTPDPDGFEPVGSISVNSLGGNFINGEAAPTLDWTGANDIRSTIEDSDEFQAIFIDLFDDDEDIFDFDLDIGDDRGASNPFIDGGVANALVPERDFFGNPRGTTPDIGAIEADPSLTSVGNPIEESGLDMAFFPNPTVDVVTVQNNDASINKFYVIVSDMTGRAVQSRVFSGINNRLDLSNVPAGIYNLQLLINGQSYVKQIVRQ